MRYCDHEFHIITISDPDKFLALGLPASIACGVVVCVYCGQVRHLYPDGNVVVAFESGNIYKNGYPTTTST